MKIYITIILALCLLIMFNTEAYSALIRGKIVDETSREPLPTATAVVKGTRIGTSTNLDGYFVLDVGSPGVYQVIFRYLGYHTREMEIVAYEKHAQQLTIELLRESVRLSDAEVSISREETSPERYSPTLSSIPLSGAAVRSMPALGGEMDILRALQTLPGVKASSDISSALHVRGGSPDQTLILMDHTVVYNPTHLFGIFSTFNADAVKHIDLMKGGFPAEYGGRSGSVLEVITNEGNRRETKGLVSLGIVSAKGAIEGPLPNETGSYAASFRRTYFDPILAAMRETTGDDIPDYYFYDANLKFNFDVSERTQVTVAGFSGDDLLTAEFGPVDTRFQMQFGWGNRTGSTRVRHSIGDNMYLTTIGAYSRYESMWTFRNDDIMIDKGVNVLDDWSLRSDLEIYKGAHRIKTGFWFTNLHMKFKEHTENITYVDVNESGNNVAFYLQDHYRINTLWEVKPSVRVTYHGPGDHVLIDPRMAAVYHYDTDLRFKAAVGRYSQFINLVSFGEGFSNFDLWIPIDKSMKATYTTQSIIGVEKDLNEQLDFTFETYYTDMQNISAFNPMANKGEVAADAFVQGYGYSYGFETLLRRKTGRWNGWFGYTISWVQHHFPETLINYGKWYYPKWDRRHDFSAVMNYKLSQKWELSGSWRYNTGQGYTQALGVFTRTMPGTDPDYMGNYGRSVMPGSKNNYRFPSDHRLDVNATYHHSFLKMPAKLHLSVFNAYNRRPYWFKSFNDNENPVEVTDIKLLPILPMISYEVRF